MKRILITGAAGFIGFHLTVHLRKRGDFCLGIDNFNSYYDPKLKKNRADQLESLGATVLKADILDSALLQKLLSENKITHIVHLAAQAGVRHSLSHPDDYISTNLHGFVSVLEACRHFPSIQFIYASSSSVYGLNEKIPFSPEDKTDRPANLYGATKKANELIAHSYHHIYGIPMTALRYFTVYGPWGRPDMALYRFTKQIQEGLPIQVFNEGQMKRDFTYIDDIVQGTLAAIDLGASFEIFNLGNNQSISLLYLIELIEKSLGKKAIKKLLPMQPGEVVETFADIEKSRRLLDFRPTICLEEGVPRFIEWFKQYHGCVEMPLAQI